MSAEHTPGPWRWKGTRGNPKLRAYLSSENGSILADPSGLDMSDADARLIASAPALAEENGKLRKVLERCVKALDGAYILDGDQECIEASQEARALLGGPSEPSHCGR